ncbi:FBD-associated F-box protein At4g10400-like [Lathyrus oleraceus]|uniref:FBD-associated F-box protein At4g10400-like n=1 Tax=Pisum sativum TaxID=3888 RepID=UPI0021CEAF60|nr:FBD-associated F-box protein At4g10400-like [Pisum sativum]
MESSDRNSSFLTAAISKRIRLTLSRQKDRISPLPDSILHHILSFLPTKDAAVTTFLSKRWKPLWLSQLLLHFDDKNFPHALAFRHFLYSFVSHRDTSLPILSFHLKCRHRLYRKQDFHNFVSSALNRRVQNLTIDLRHSFSSPITAKTLLVLKLRMLTFDKTPLVYLPSLKLLHLESVNFRNHEYLCRLLLGCPLLEELEVKDSIVNTLDRQCRRVAGLSNLIRANISDIHIDLNWLHNVEHLRLQVDEPSIVDCMFHNLTRMEVIFDFTWEMRMKKWTWLIKLLQNFPKLDTLIIHDVDILKDFCDEIWEDPEIVPKCFLSHLTTCSLRNYSRINWEFQFAKYIMENSRVLKTMTIQSAKFVDTRTKLQMLMELSLCTRNSTTCKLLLI